MFCYFLLVRLGMSLIGTSCIPRHSWLKFWRFLHGLWPPWSTLSFPTEKLPILWRYQLTAPPCQGSFPHASSLWIVSHVSNCPPKVRICGYVLTSRSYFLSSRPSFESRVGKMQCATAAPPKQFGYEKYSGRSYYCLLAVSHKFTTKLRISFWHSKFYWKQISVQFCPERAGK